MDEFRESQQKATALRRWPRVFFDDLHIATGCSNTGGVVVDEMVDDPSVEFGVKLDSPSPWPKGDGLVGFLFRNSQALCAWRQLQH